MPYVSDELQCPSADPAMAGAKVIGVVRDGTAAVAVDMLAEAVDPALVLDLIPADFPVRAVLRFAGPCGESACVHYANARCRLATRIVEQLPAVTERIARCAIRPVCRWWRQEGVAACRRCPQIVTEPLAPTDAVVAAAGAQSRKGNQP